MVIITKVRNGEEGRQTGKKASKGGEMRREETKAQNVVGPESELTNHVQLVSSTAGRTLQSICNPYVLALLGLKH